MLIMPVLLRALVTIKKMPGFFIKYLNNRLPKTVCVASQYQKLIFKPSGASSINCCIRCGICSYTDSVTRPPILYPASEKRLLCSTGILLMILRISFVVHIIPSFQTVFPCNGRSIAMMVYLFSIALASGIKLSAISPKP